MSDEPDEVSITRVGEASQEASAAAYRRMEAKLRRFGLKVVGEFSADLSDSALARAYGELISVAHDASSRGNLLVVDAQPTTEPGRLLGLILEVQPVR